MSGISSHFSIYTFSSQDLFLLSWVPVAAPEGPADEDDAAAEAIVAATAPLYSPLTDFSQILASLVLGFVVHVCNALLSSGVRKDVTSKYQTSYFLFEGRYLILMAGCNLVLAKYCSVLRLASRVKFLYDKWLSNLLCCCIFIMFCGDKNTEGERRA